MTQLLSKNWLFLALCGVVEAVVSTLYLLMQNENEPLTLHNWRTLGLFAGKLTVAAGACSIAAGLWGSLKGKRESWLLVLNGVACSLLGVLAFWTGRLSFRTIALLFAAMALSAGLYELLTARALWPQRPVAREWLLGLTGAVSIAFALAFLALGFHWIRIDLLFPFRSLADYMWWKSDFLWFSAYFGFSAICMLVLAIFCSREERLNRSHLMLITGSR